MKQFITLAIKIESSDDILLEDIESAIASALSYLREIGEADVINSTVEYSKKVVEDRLKAL